MKKYIKATNSINTVNKDGKKYRYVDYVVDKNKLFYGVPDVYFIYINDWSDPYVEYDGELYNYYDLEDSLWNYYTEVCEEAGVKATDADFEQNFVTADRVYNELFDLDPVAPSENIEVDGSHRYAVFEV